MHQYLYLYISLSIYIYIHIYTRIVLMLFMLVCFIQSTNQISTPGEVAISHQAIPTRWCIKLCTDVLLVVGLSYYCYYYCNYYYYYYHYYFYYY